MFRIITLNVNGIRSAATKGLFRWIRQADPDVLCLQEVKAHEEDIPEAQRFPDGLHGFFHCAQKKGYSGTAVYAKKHPRAVKLGFGVPEFDAETMALLDAFYTLRGDVLRGAHDRFVEFREQARLLADRGIEVADIVQSEVLQVARQIGVSV